MLKLLTNFARINRFVKTTITVPEEYLGRVIELCEGNRGVQNSLEFFHTDQVILSYDIPAAQLVDDLFGKLKGIS
jgi:translation elongation factor EF-4